MKLSRMTGAVGLLIWMTAACDAAEVNLSAAPADGALRSGNPVFEGWYADPEAQIFKSQCWIYPTYSAKYNQQVFFDAFSSPDLVHWTKHSRILDTNRVSWAWRAMWAPAVAERKGKYYLFFGANDIHDENKEVGGIGVAVGGEQRGRGPHLFGKPPVEQNRQ